MLADTRGAPAVPTVEAAALRRLVNDLRMPLASVVGHLDLVLEGGAGPLSVELREFVAVAARNADAVLGMLDVDRFADALGVEVSRTGVSGSGVSGTGAVRPGAGGPRAGGGVPAGDAAGRQNA
jgi:hypothetical protein